MLRNWFRTLTQPLRNRTRTTQQEVLLGLGAPVEIRTTTSGVCHIFAKQEEDMFRAQGFVTARDRLFQMDTARRAAGGRLAEWYGDVPAMGFDPVLHLKGQGLASVDHLMRTLGLQQAAEQSLSWLSPTSHRALLAYSEGVNEWIYTARKQKSLALGYNLLDMEPEGWSPTDSLLILRLLGYKLSFSWRLLLAFGAVCFKLYDQPEKLRSMLPSHLHLSLDSLHELQPFRAPEALWTEPSLAPSAEDLGHWPTGTGQGSCAWVIGGEQTKSGAPILCNDPHLALQLPSAFYQIRLHSTTYNTIGLSIPGHPGVYAGHNADIAWGASLSRTDDADIFLEEVQSDDETYRNQERILPLIRREEVIRVRGEKARHRWVRSTLRGPLLSDALRGPMPEHLHYSLAWTGHEGVRETEAILQLNRAENWNDFRRAVQYARVPSLGFVYADKLGNIGGVLAGRCPIRSHTPRRFHPLPGADEGYNWKGEVPFEELPYCYNPESGIIVLSGQRPQAPLRGRSLNGFWEMDHRSSRIQALIRRTIEIHEKVDAEHMGRLQRDQYTLWGSTFIREKLASFGKKKMLSPEVQSSLERLLEWNGRMGAESLSAAYLSMFQLKLVEQAYQPALGDPLVRRWLEIAHELEPPVEALFRAESSWFKRDADAAIHFALTQTYHALQKRLGSDPKQWTWKRLHRLTLRPSFFWDNTLVQKLHRGPYGTGGDAFCINAGTHSWARPFEHRVGASARQTFDLARLEQSHWILCGGQSEHHLSPHYDDQLDNWLHGDSVRMHFSPKSLESMPTQWLLPTAQRMLPPSTLSTLNQAPPRGHNLTNPADTGKKESTR